MICVMSSTRRIRLSLTYICPLKCQKCEKLTDKKLVKDIKKLAKMVEKLVEVIEKLVKVIEKLVEVIKKLVEVIEKLMEVIESRRRSTWPGRRGWSSSGVAPEL